MSDKAEGFGAIHFNAMSFMGSMASLGGSSNTADTLDKNVSVGSTDSKKSVRFSGGNPAPPVWESTLKQEQNLSRRTRSPVRLERRGSGTVHDIDDEPAEEEGDEDLAAADMIIPKLSKRKGRRRRKDASPEDFGDSDLIALEHLRPSPSKSSVVAGHQPEQEEEPTPEGLMRECFSLCK